MKTLICVFLSLLVFLPAYSMQSVKEEKLILIMEPSNDNRSVIPATVIRAIEERLAKNFPHGVSRDTMFDLTCSTPKEAREHFPNSPLHIVMLGAGEAPIDYNNPGKSFMAKNLTEIAIIGNEMLEDNLQLTYQCLQVPLSKETIESNNFDAFKQAALFLVNPSNAQANQDIKKIMDKLMVKFNKK